MRHHHNNQQNIHRVHRIGLVALVGLLLAGACSRGQATVQAAAAPAPAAVPVTSVPAPTAAPAPPVVTEAPVAEAPVIEEPAAEPVAVASSVGAGADTLATFVVGDSTFVEAAAVTGVGSAYSGHGFTEEAAMGLWNPLDAPPEGYDGLVVLGVSLWDAWADDLSGYRAATDHYRALGFDVVWIEVPEAGVHYRGGERRSDFVELNARVAEELGCDLQPWELRNVESYGSVAGDPDGDWVHPTPLGGFRIAANVSRLTAADACVPVVQA